MNGGCSAKLEDGSVSVRGSSGNSGSDKLSALSRHILGFSCSVVVSSQVGSDGISNDKLLPSATGTGAGLSRLGASLIVSSDSSPIGHSPFAVE